MFQNVPLSDHEEIIKERIALGLDDLIFLMLRMVI